MLTHANMVAHTVNAHDGWVFERRRQVNMVAMPLFHVGGSSYVLFGIHDGIPSLMTRDPDGASLAGAILAGANRTFLVPAVLAQVLQAGRAGGEAVRQRSRPTRTAPSPMPPPLLRAAMAAWPDDRLHPGLRADRGRRRGYPPDARGTTATPSHPERLVSAGQPIPGIELKIVDPVTLDELPAGEHGEIWLRTPAADEGLPRQAGGDGRGDAARTAGSAPVTWARSTTRASSSSRTGSRT